MKSICALFLSLSVGLAPAVAADADKVKEALQELHEFIGAWKGNGGPSTGGKPSDNWKEEIVWGWKFSKSGPALQIEFTNGKYFDKGELTYVDEKTGYQLTLIDKQKQNLVFTGQLKRGILELNRIDPQSKDKQTITMSTNNDGVRFIYDYKVQTGGKGIAKKIYLVQHTKEGASIGSKNENECVVTGGKGTMAVSFGGKTYYVCCSGCRDAFNENPKKFVDEFEAKKKKK